MRTFRDIALTPLDEKTLSKKDIQKLEELGQEVIQELGKTFSYKIDKLLGLQIYNDTPTLLGNFGAYYTVKEVVKKSIEADKYNKSMKPAKMSKNLDWSKQSSKDGWTGD